MKRILLVAFLLAAACNKDSSPAAPSATPLSFFVTSQTSTTGNLGGIAGAALAAWGGRGLAESKILGIPLGGREMRIGPVKNSQFLYILLDRSLIYYSHIINWAHGRRDYGAGQTERDAFGYTSQWNSATLATCTAFFREATGSGGSVETEVERKLKNILVEQLLVISKSEDAAKN